MPFVLDATVAASWAFDDEANAKADAAILRARAEEIVVPALWYFEVRNTLVVNERRGRITPVAAGAFLRTLSLLRIIVDRLPGEVRLLDFARRHRLTVYDAAYLELAYRTGLDLATLDAALVKAAQAESVTLVA